MSSEVVLYSTAIIDGSKEFVDISRVNNKNHADRDYRKKHTFTCPCCGLEMRAVLRDIRAIHFPTSERGGYHQKTIMGWGCFIYNRYLCSMTPKLDKRKVVRIVIVSVLAWVLVVTAIFLFYSCN